MCDCSVERMKVGYSSFLPIIDLTDVIDDVVAAVGGVIVAGVIVVVVVAVAVVAIVVVIVTPYT